MSTPFTNTVPVVSVAPSADYRISSLLDGERDVIVRLRSAVALRLMSRLDSTAPERLVDTESPVRGVGFGR